MTKIRALSVASINLTYVARKRRDASINRVTASRLLVGGLLGGVLDEGHDGEEAGDDHARVGAPVFLVLAVVVLVLVVQRLLRVRQRVVIVLARLGVAQDLQARTGGWEFSASSSAGFELWGCG